MKGRKTSNIRPVKAPVTRPSATQGCYTMVLRMARPQRHRKTGFIGSACACRTTSGRSCGRPRSPARCARAIPSRRPRRTGASPPRSQAQWAGLPSRRAGADAQAAARDRRRDVPRDGRRRAGQSRQARGALNSGSGWTSASRPGHADAARRSDRPLRRRVMNEFLERRRASVLLRRASPHALLGVSPTPSSRPTNNC